MPHQPTGFIRSPGRFHGITALLMSMVVPMAMSMAPGAAAASRAEHSVREMRAADSGRSVEIEVESSEPFHFGGDVTVLKIGSAEFTRSHFPADGNPRRMIFEVPAAAYQQLPDAQEMSVVHGHDDRHPDRRPVGRLDKARLKGRIR